MGSQKGFHDSPLATTRIRAYLCHLSIEFDQLVTLLVNCDESLDAAISLLL